MKSGGAGGSDGTGQQGSRATDDENSFGAGQPVSAAPGSDGGGSPLVPILIAILVLAGGSVAYVVMKRRRAGAVDSSGSPISPEAS